MVPRTASAAGTEREGKVVEAFNQVTAVSAGTMGHGLSLLFALGGSRVCLVDVSRDCLNQAMQLIRSHLKSLDLQRRPGN